MCWKLWIFRHSSMFLRFAFCAVRFIVLIYINDYFLFATPHHRTILLHLLAVYCTYAYRCGYVCVCVSAIFPPRYFSRWNLHETEKKNSLMEAHILGSVLDTFKGLNPNRNTCTFFVCVRVCVCVRLFDCVRWLIWVLIRLDGLSISVFFYYFRNVVIIQSSFRLSWDCFRFIVFLSFRLCGVVDLSWKFRSFKISMCVCRVWSSIYTAHSKFDIVFDLKKKKRISFEIESFDSKIRVSSMWCDW